MHLFSPPTANLIFRSYVGAASDVAPVQTLKFPHPRASKHSSSDHRNDISRAALLHRRHKMTSWGLHSSLVAERYNLVLAYFFVHPKSKSRPRCHCRRGYHHVTTYT